MNKILLIGFKSSGKTTLGQLLSNDLQIPFYDLDHLLLKNNPTYPSIRSLFYALGEKEFRKQERKLLLAWQKNSEGIFSSGAGAFDLEISASWQNHFSIRIFIDTHFQTISSRIEKGYPYLQNIETLYKKRILQYEKICTHKLSLTNESLSEALINLKRLIYNGQ